VTSYLETEHIDEWEEEEEEEEETIYLIPKPERTTMKKLLLKFKES